ncbi:MAG: hypothetical protein D6726_08955 [Nitrospirae bacterium]|nr:MAG: hypothetical protein D6726_08955 [Nitrospirota bacterium]
MIVIIKSGPETVRGKRGLKIARDMAADVVFIQDGVYFALNEMIEGFCGSAYAIEDDVKLRGLSGDMRDIKIISWDELTDLMFEDEEGVKGAF